MAITTSEIILSKQAHVVLEHRYFLKNNEGKITEDGCLLFKRVAK